MRAAELGIHPKAQPRVDGERLEHRKQRAQPPGQRTKRCLTVGDEQRHRQCRRSVCSEHGRVQPALEPNLVCPGRTGGAAGKEIVAGMA